MKNAALIPNSRKGAKTMKQAAALIVYFILCVLAGVLGLILSVVDRWSPRRLK